MSDINFESEMELESFPIFKDFTEDELKPITSIIEIHEFQIDETIFIEGEQGNHIYFVEDGIVKIYKKLPGGQNKEIATIYPRKMFGEMALMALIKGTQRSGTAIAESYVKLFSLNRINFDRLMKTHPNIGIKMLRNIGKTISTNLRKADELHIDDLPEEKHLNFRKSSQTHTKLPDISNVIYYIPFFTGLPKDKIDKIIRPLLTIDKFKDGQIIFNEGDEGDKLYFLIEGSVDILKQTSAGTNRKIFTIYPLSSFGEMAMIDYSNRSASVLAKSDVTTFSLSRNNFEKIISDHPAIAINILKCTTRAISTILRESNDFYIKNQDKE